jgi:hypothetical protein
LLADALDRSGQADAARAHYVSAFDLDPRVFRALSLAIPVRVHSDNDSSSRAAASWLKGSPRFRSGNAFVVEVTRSADGIEATLEDPSGTVLGRAGVPWAKEGGKESAWLLCQEAQLKFFQPKINQEQANLNSLDGSTLQGDADTVLERQVVYFGPQINADERRFPLPKRWVTRQDLLIRKTVREAVPGRWSEGLLLSIAINPTRQSMLTRDLGREY